MGKHPATARRLLPLLLAAAGITLTATPATAAPATAADTGRQLEIVTEQFNTARETSARAAAAAADATKADAAAVAALNAARAQVRTVARSAYTGSQITGAEAVLTAGSSGDLITRLGTLHALSDHTADVARSAKDAAKAAATAKADAVKAAAKAKADTDALAGRQQQLTADIANYQAQTRALSARQLAATTKAIAAPATTVATAAKVTAVAAPAAATSGATGGAVQRALSQLGKPYVWAANGPGSFDCSGLVQFAYPGLGLPHSSAMQSRMGTRISRAEARPGDLVAFYSPVSHIGIYLGDGKMVHAPTTGDVVKVASVDVMGAAPQFNRIG